MKPSSLLFRERTGRTSASPPPRERPTNKHRQKATTNKRYQPRSSTGQNTETRGGGGVPAIQYSGWKCVIPFSLERAGQALSLREVPAVRCAGERGANEHANDSSSPRTKAAPCLLSALHGWFAVRPRCHTRHYCTMVTA